MQYLGDQEAQFAVAQHHHSVAGSNMYLFQDLAGGGQGLDEDGLLVGQGVGDAMEKASGQREKIGHGAVPSTDAQYGSVGTMSKVAAPTGRASATIAIDLTYHALSHQRGGAVGADDFPDELMSQHAAKSLVAAQDLHIGIADTGQPGANEGLVGTGRGHRKVAIEP